MLVNNAYQSGEKNTFWWMMCYRSGTLKAHRSQARSQDEVVNHCKIESLRECSLENAPIKRGIFVFIIIPQKTGPWAGLM